MHHNKWIFISGIILLVIGLISFTILTLRTWNKVKVTANSATTATGIITPTAIPTPDPDAPLTIALLGYGGGNHDGGFLTDSIMIARLEPKNKLITLISVPRDLWVPLPVNGNTIKMSKINAAYAVGADDKKYPHKLIQFTGPAGGGEMAKSVLSSVTGFKIDYFASIDFVGFQKVIDKLGGITVKLTRPFDDPFYPLDVGITDTCGKTEGEIATLTATMSGDKLEQMFSCRYETLHFSVGTTQMDGATALKFARSRHSTTDGGDFARAARQRLVIESIKNKVISIGFLPKIVPTIETLANHLKFDFDLALIEKLIARADEFSQYQITSLALTDQNVLMNSKSADGQYILTTRVGETNYSEIQDYLNHPESFITPTATPSVKRKVNNLTPNQ